MAELLIPIVKKTQIPGVESRNPSITTAKKLRADRVVATRTATDELVIDFSNVEPMDSKGQMWVYNDEGAVSALDVGTEGQVLRVKSAASTGVAWTNDPTNLVNGAGELLTFNSDTNSAVSLSHPGGSNAGYVLTSTDPATAQPGIAWASPTLRIEGTHTITSTGAPLLGVSDNINLSWMYVTANSVRVEVSEINFTAQASANLTFDLPIQMPLPSTEQRFFVVTKNGASFADSLMVLNPSAASGQMVTITPNRTHATLSPTFTASSSCKVYGFVFEYLIQ